MKIGAKIKQLRNLRQLTQEELANRCELTKSYISLLENEKTSPSIATLDLILEVLGTNLSDFFNDDKKPKIVFKENDQNEAVNEGIITNFLIPTAQKLLMESILVSLAPDSQTVIDRPHKGEEFGYVLKGSVEINYGTQKEICSANESFYYTANKNHYLRNITTEEALILWVSCPPNF